MALINCPECNREVSSTSSHCIHCGYNPPQQQQYQQNQYNQNPLTIQNQDGNKYGVAIAAIICSLTIIGGLPALIMGAVAMDANKPVRINGKKQKNKAFRYGKLAFILGAITQIIFGLYLVITP
jgi:hypothetical protein